MDKRHTVHRAFTMFELLVVLTILAAVAALAIPRLRATVGRSHLQRTAQQLAEDLTTARLLAIEHGVTYVIQRDSDGHQYVVRPQWISSHAPETAQNQRIEPASPTGVSSVASSADLAATSSRSELPPKSSATGPTHLPRQPEIIDGELADGVTFDTPMSLAGVPGTEINTESQLGRRLAVGRQSVDRSNAARGMESANASESWTLVARFFPDGRAGASNITLYSGDGYRIELTIRRLTGGVRVGQIERRPVMDIDADSRVPPRLPASPSTGKR